MENNVNSVIQNTNNVKKKKKFNYFALIGVICVGIGIIFFSIGYFADIIDYGNEYILAVAFSIATAVAAIVFSTVGLALRNKKFNGSGLVLSLIGVIIGYIFLGVMITLIFALSPAHWMEYSSTNNQYSNSSTNNQYSNSSYDNNVDNYSDSSDSNSTDSESKNNKDSNSSDYKPKTKTAEEIKNEYIAECQSYTYDEIARRPDDFINKKATFTGKVVQVSEVGTYSVVLRVNITKQTYEYIDYVSWKDTIYVTYTYGYNESKILEDDIITMYGVLDGSETYTSVLGAKITIPRFEAKYVTINQ